MLFPSTLARLPEGHPHARILVRDRLQLTPLKGVGVTGLSIGLSFYPFVPGALKVGPELLILAAKRGHSRDVPALRRGLQLAFHLGEMGLQSGDQLLMVYCLFPFLLFRGALRPLARRAEPSPGRRLLLLDCGRGAASTRSGPPIPRMCPVKRRATPSSTISSCCASSEIRWRSCDTMSRVPGKSASAPSSASLLGMSRCVVGSSRTRKFGSETSSRATESLVLSPPLNALTSLKTSSPVKRNLAR